MLYLFHVFYSLASGLRFLPSVFVAGARDQSQEKAGAVGSIPCCLSWLCQMPQGYMGTWLESTSLRLFPGFVLLQAPKHLSRLGSSSSSILVEAQQRVACGYPHQDVLGKQPHCIHPNSHGSTAAPCQICMQLTSINGDHQNQEFIECKYQ